MNTFRISAPIVVCIVSLSFFVTGCSSSKLSLDDSGPQGANNGNTASSIEGLEPGNFFNPDSSSTRDQASFPEGFTRSDFGVGASSSSQDRSLVNTMDVSQSPEALLGISGFPGINFGRVPVGSKMVKRIYIANFGASSAKGLFMSLIPFDPDFKYLTGSCGIELGSLKSCWIDVEFSPSIERGYEASFEVLYQTALGSVGRANRIFRGQGVSQPHTIAMGEYHTCATIDGLVKCWGFNGNGELGDNSTTNSNLPVAVYGIESGATKVSVGYRQSCAIVRGALKCWGRNDYGQLGLGDRTKRTVPIQVPGFERGVTDISNSHLHACAIKDDGAYCWGRGVNGELGNGEKSNSNNPVSVSGLNRGVRQVVTGQHFSCALTFGGSVKCWGYNNYGQLGNNTRTTASAPVQVVGLEGGVAHLAANNAHVCAAKESGEAVCWGYNGYGQLGDNTKTSSSVPVPVYGFDSRVSQMALTNTGACAIRDNRVYCWGLNSYGALGNGSTTSSLVPIEVYNTRGEVTSLSADRQQVCAVVDGQARCWGHNDYGMLGDGTRSRATLPVAVDIFSLYQH